MTFTVLRESNDEILLLLLIVCAPDLTKACRDSLLHSVHPEVLEPQSGVVLQWVAAAHQMLGLQVERADSEAWTSAVLFLCVVCHPSEFLIIRFIYYSVFFKAHFSLPLKQFPSVSHCFPSALSHSGHLFHGVQDDCRAWKMIVCVILACQPPCDVLGRACPF